MALQNENIYLQVQLQTEMKIYFLVPVLCGVVAPAFPARLITSS